MTGGPFAEARERVAGYFPIDAKDRDESIGTAARVPGARIGSVEVRAPLTLISEAPRLRVGRRGVTTPP